MLSFLTNEYAGVGGVIKTRAEDFFVEELPLYQPSGEGTHVYILIEKKELSTMAAMAEIAADNLVRLSTLGTLERELMKDSLAIIKAFRQHLRLHYRLDFL
jgi:tRNA(Glu) U13 pseudouridine synthase TruD